jgi:acyl transferase domain-containing protein
LKNSAPIAIIGIGCRFPGASGAEEFWRVLDDGLETTSDYPGGRLPAIDRVYAGAREIATRRGGFLPQIDQFDAEFFRISPREAAELDPQQRLLLEVGWEAVEDAGIPVGKMAGTSTAVYAGLWTSDYERALWEQSGDPDFYATTGGGRYSASGRLAYFFDLRGPNLTLDTACSSSLVAIHLACQSLRLRESEMALAGGANVILCPEITQAYSAANMLSPDGRSKFGDAAADGYVRSEGAALLLLKPLEEALADGDPVYAVIRGSAVNNDGHSSGLLISPSPDGQEALLRAAYRNAGVDSGDVDYIEAHGTGTLVGDPVEIEAIGRVVATPKRRRACAIGSLKTNIGHTESAAGVAGVIKVALALGHGILPASLHYREPNSAIAWNQLPVRVQSARSPWPHAEQQRIAGVSGFGITGTNAHIVLENLVARPGKVQPGAGSEAGEVLFVLSGASSKALEAVAESWQRRLESDPAWPESLRDLAYTAAVRRTHHEYRLAVVAASREELKEKLAGWLRGEEVEGVRQGRRRSSDGGKTVFIYPGQGGQWNGMARGLMSNPNFCAGMEECDAALRKYTGWSVLERLAADAASIPDDVAVVQPCLFAVMVGLTMLWRSWGVEAQAVVGHSMGESIAAWACGALSLEDAAAVICSRSDLMQRASGKGLMAFADLTLEEASALAQQYEGRLSVAANNSPGSTVLSGEPDAVRDAIRVLTEGEVFCRLIKVDVASHSSQMEPFCGALEERLGGIRPRAGRIPLYSTTTGKKEDGSGLGAKYWSRNLRQPVLFSTAVQSLLEDGFETFVEMNAHPVLTQSVESGMEHAGRAGVVVGSTRRERSEPGEMLSALGTLYVSGYPVEFRRLYPEGSYLRLPLYPWQRERHWIEVAERIRGDSSSPGVKRSNDAFALTWSEQSAPQRSGKTGLWIVTGKGKLAEGTADALRSAGHECLRVAEYGELERALQTVGAVCRGVVRVAEAAGDEPNAAAAEAWEIVRTVRAAAAAPARLWLVSNGLWSLSLNEELNVAQSAAWGLGRVIEREHPELRSMNVDLPAEPEGIDFQELGWVLAGQDGPDEAIAIRGGKRFAARYERLDLERSGFSFYADASYLIAGASGGIGQQLAGWMVDNGARHLGLAARRPADERMQSCIAALEAKGAEVRVFQADMAVDGDCAGVLETMRKQMPRLKGVFHLAAAFEPGLMATLEEATLRQVMRSKADAAWLLDRHLRETELDFFVLFSSIAAAISQPGLAAYASANAYVEALARARRQRGLKGQSIAWGSWASTGLSTNDAVDKGVSAYTQMGIHPVEADAALADLGRMMRLDAANVLALSVEWDRFGQSFDRGAAPRIFERLLPERESAAGAGAEESLRAELEAADPARRRTLLEAQLTERLAAVLRTSAGRIDTARPFGLMGVDSLMALQFVRRLAVATSLRLPAAVVFNYPTIQKLAAEIAKRMGIALHGAAVSPAADRAPSSPVPSAAATGGLEALTDEEALEALMRKGPGR